MFDPLIAARAAHFIATTMVAGALFFAVFVVDPAIRAVGESAVVPRIHRLLAWIIGAGLALALVSGAVWLVLLSAEISGRPLSAMIASDVVLTVLTQTQFGHVWQVRVGLGALLALAMALDHRQRWRTSRMAAGIKAALAAGLVGSLAWSGHGAADEGANGMIHVVADVLHLIAAAAWLGALAPLAVLFVSAWHSRDTRDAALTLAATPRFSTLGVISVATLLTTGIVNTWFLAGSIPALVGTDYGRLLLVKIALFAAMVGLASINRLTLTPRLADDPSADQSHYSLRQLARNTALEAALGVVILVIVGILGTTPPGLHVQPLWPFPLRFDDAAINIRALGTPLIFVVATVLAIVLFFVGTRLLRWVALAGGLVSAVFVVFSLRGFTVPAFPTSYYVSPTGHTAASIARGHLLFNQSCIGCHRLGGGPADLTADHIYAHTDGDLFWWVSHGVDNVMPGFAGAIDDDARWNLIDFIHANADAARLRDNAENVGFPTPDFTADCPDGSIISPSDLRGRLVHLVTAGTHSAARLQQLAHSHIAHDLTTIVIASKDAPVNDLPFCATQEVDVRVAFAVYRGEDEAASEGTEFLIDATGQLRALWYPGLEPAWTDEKALRQHLRDISNAVASSRAAAPHMRAHQ
jgi:putative copper resistance protein D